MDADLQSWRDAKRAFDRVIHLPVGRRRARLERMRLSPDAFRHALSLVAAQEHTGGVLDVPLAINPGVGSLAGTQLGPWLLETELGRGGSAVVYRARARDGATERLCAVKLLTLGSLARVGLDRFHHEQRVLARLNHPHIAQLFDVGQARDGTPWLAMALVDGVPIDVWCRERNLPPRAIVRLFLDVCDAVDYAHRSLVIHRDIKPSNVLVDTHGHVRLLDFGIARLVDEDHAATETQWRALTPQYAAPEQFSGAVPSTAMDVYGLGALLYRLLTGRVPRPPGAREDLLPTAPSRVTNPPAPGLAPNARRELRGDLDHVVLKALAPAPGNRYTSVVEFATDLRHWLRGEVVSATPPSFAYRAWKFIRRNALLVGAALALFLALLGGITATAWQSHRAQQEAARALAVKRFVTEMLGETAPDSYSGVTTDIRDALARGAERARRDLADSPDVEAELLLLIGRLQSSFHQYEPAHRQFDAALRITEQQVKAAPLRGAILAQRAQTLARELKYAEALPAFDLAISELSRQAPDDALFQAYLGRSETLQWLGKLEPALTDTERAAAIDAVLEPAQSRRRKALYVQHGSVLFAAGRVGESEQILRRAQAIAPDLPGDFALYELLGNALLALQRWDEAESAYRHALELVRRGYPAGSPVLARPLSYLAVFLRRTGRLEEAERLVREGIEVQRANLAADSPALAVHYGNLGTVVRDLGRTLEALTYLRKASVMADAQYGVPALQSARVLAHVAQALAQGGQRVAAAQAIVAVRHRLDTARGAGVENPLVFTGTYDVAARAALAVDDPGLALDLLETALAIGTNSAAAVEPATLDRAALRAMALDRAGFHYEAAVRAREIEADLGRMGAGMPFYERAETYAILALIALSNAEHYRAGYLASAALERRPGVRYPLFVESELSALERKLGTGH